PGAELACRLEKPRLHHVRVLAGLLLAPLSPVRSIASRPNTSRSTLSGQDLSGSLAQTSASSGAVASVFGNWSRPRLSRPSSKRLLSSARSILACSLALVPAEPTSSTYPA